MAYLLKLQANNYPATSFISLTLGVIISVFSVHSQAASFKTANSSARRGAHKQKIPHFGKVWPAGTKEIHGTIIPKDIAMFNRAIQSGEIGRWDLYDKKGKLVISKEFQTANPHAGSALGNGRAYNDYQLSHADILAGCKSMLNAVMGQTANNFSKVCLTHCHVNKAKLGWFSGEDRQVGSIYRDYLSRSGLSTLPFEMRLLYRNSNRRRNVYQKFPAQEIGLKVMELPATSSN